MLAQLEQLVVNLGLAISEMNVNDYPLLSSFRSKSSIIVHQHDGYHRLLEDLDFTDPDLKDNWQSFGYEVVTLNHYLVGLRVADHVSETRPVYWLRVKSPMSPTEYNDLYDLLAGFISSTPEDQRHAQRIELNECGALRTWQSLLRNVVENPRTLVIGNINYPGMYFSPSPDLYVRARDNRDGLVLPANTTIPADNFTSGEVWFVIRKEPGRTIAL